MIDVLLEIGSLISLNNEQLGLRNAKSQRIGIHIPRSPTEFSNT